MNQENKHGHSILGSLFSIADQLEPLAEKKSPGLAATIAFFLGGVGLGLYLRSWRDFLIPWGILFVVLILGVITFETGLVIVPFIWASYAYRRVVASNAQLGGGGNTSRIIEAEIVSPPPIPTRQNRPT